jgi:predicted signal transduction protein with EAL and GGDEF domain
MRSSLIPSPRWLARAFGAVAPTPRVTFEETVDNMLQAGTALTLVYVNIERFRSVVRLCGADGADRILRILADRFARTFGAAAVVRLPGDEFLLRLAVAADDVAMGVAMQELARLIALPFPVPGGGLALSAAIGTASSARDGASFQQLYDHAEQQMLGVRSARHKGPRRTADVRELADAASIETALRMALERDEFVLFYQPQVDLATGTVTGAEALIRWAHPERGLLAPGQFIEAAERNGMIVPIGRWVLREACRQAAHWRKAGYDVPMMAVNLSACQFESGTLDEVVRDALECASLPPSGLELELTETILIRDTDNVLKQIQRLKSMGLTLSLDDFGTGYSSLSYLKKFAVDKIKIDRSFVSGLAEDPNDATIVRAIVQIARSLGLRTIAEGVEDARTLDCLRLLSCDEVQGYHFAPPLPASAFEKMLRVLQRYPECRCH